MTPNPQPRFPTQEAAAYYLAAMIDGEGSVSVTYTSSPQQNRRCVRYVEVGNTDSGLIAAFIEACDLLGIETRTYVKPRPKAHPKWSDGWVVQIGKRESLQIVVDKVSIQSSKKQAKLRELLGSYWRGTEGSRHLKSQAAIKGWEKWRQNREVLR